MNTPLKKIKQVLSGRDLDGLIVSSNANICYLSGYLSRDAYLLVSRKECLYFTDSRYIEELKAKLKGFRLVKTDGFIFKLIASCSLDLGLREIAFEERIMPYAEFKQIKNFLGNRAKLIPTHGFVEELRQCKVPKELDKLRQALKIAKDSLRSIEGFICPGRSEREIAGELERAIRYRGGYASAFEIIVASGPNSCYPHHLTSGRKLKANEPVMIDLGVDYCGYKSDLTRVFFTGKINLLARRIKSLVQKAQEASISKIRPGLSAREIDAAARGCIAKAGLGRYFVHNSGHGIGLEVHEAPQISAHSGEILQPGMVFTVEPAVYLPGKFGIRIEDMVLVTRHSSEVL